MTGHCDNSGQLLPGWMCVARRMGSPRQVRNRRRTREGPEPACVQVPLRSGVARRGGRMNQHPAVVPSSRRGKNLQ